jgi:hypothetical protein
MADPKPKSLEPPYLWRIPTLWQMPQWQQANVWRWLVYNQPIAMLCRARLINYLLGLPWEITAKDPDEKDKVEEDARYYTAWVLRSFDLIFDKLWQDALDLPVGGVVEIVRWPAGVKPIIREGEEEYKVTRDHPKGHPFRLVNLDGATVFPTFEPDIPLAQKIPELDKVVYFTETEIGRIGIQPRTEMRLQGYFKAPPEQIYLAMQMVNDTDHYYHDLVKEVPPVGILDLTDMQEHQAKDWVGSVRSLFEGSDPFKIPVLYDHEQPAVFIPFGKSPQELLFDTASLRYARIVAGSYGLTLGNLGLEPKGETLAGSIRDDMQASQGYGYVIEKTKNLLDAEVLPPYLEWSPKIQDFEKLTGKGRAFLVVAQALKAAKEIGAIKPSEVQAQLVRDGFITVEVEPPNDEELAQQAQAKQLPFGGKPGANSNGAAKQLTDKVPAAEGGLGDVKKEKALILQARVRDNEAHTDMSETLKYGFSKLNDKATPARLTKLAKAVAKIITPLVGKAELPDDWQEALDKIIASEDWYTLPDSIKSTLTSAYKSAYSEGATVAAEEVLAYLAEHALLDAAPVGIDFTLTNPRTLKELEQKAALLVRRIDDGTRYYLKRMLVSGVEEGLPSEEIARRVKAELEGMTRERVESIVNTEINRAESEGRLGQWSEMGLTRKAWRTFGEACPICRGNEAQGFVEMAHVYDDVFDGTLTPPAHPQVCRCDLMFDEQELMDKAGELTVWEGD